MIIKDYVSFEIAKLLKEKGFTANIHGMYDHDGKFCESTFTDVEPYYCCYAPTLQMAMKWLRDEKHYYIQVMLDGWAYGSHLGYYVVIQKTDSDFEMMLQDAVDEVFYQTYEKACEAAIKYCLENLI